MRIASYNLWDDRRGMPGRQGAAEAELRRVGADVLCLQEASGAAKRLAEACGYPFYWQEGGLALLSRLPALRAGMCGAALALTVEPCRGATLTVLNVHLPWDSILTRERQITEILAALPGGGCAVLCGDFNGDDDDSVQRFLCGRQSLLGAEARPVWSDLAREWAAHGGGAPAPTLALGANPRWRAQRYRPDAGVRMDRVLLRETYPAPAPRLAAFALFGTEVTDGWRPSDHFGVAAELDFDTPVKTE